MYTRRPSARPHTTVAAASAATKNDVVTLADGKSVMAVWRMGAGDGLIWNKSLGINGSYHFYNHAISTDGGLTFSPEAPMPTMGCAKPMLTRVDGVNMPVILGGGRKRLMNTSDVWANSDGMGQTWDEYSISFWHNELAKPPLKRFTPQVNSTAEPRQTSSYVCPFCMLQSQALTSICPFL